MEIKVNDVGQCRKSIKITVPAEEIQKEYTEKVKSLQSESYIKGFRAGRTPLNIIEKKFGKSILDEMKYTYISKAFQTAMTENKLKPFGEPKLTQPEFTLEKEKAFEFEFVLDVQPEFTLPEYKNLEATKQSSEVTEEDIQTTLEDLRKRYAELVLVEDGVAQKDDVVFGNATIKIGDTEVWNKTNLMLSVTDTNLMGIPFTADFLLNHKVGEVLTKKVTLPNDFKTEEHRGKEADFSMTLVEIKRVKLPEINDQLAAEIGFKDLTGVKEFLKMQIAVEKESANNYMIEHDLLHRLLETVKIELPEAFIEEKVKESKQRIDEERKAKGEKLPEKEEEIKEDEKTIRERIIADLKEYLLLDRIAEQEKIEVNEDEVDQHIKAIASRYHKWPTEVKQDYEKSGVLDELRYETKTRKVLKFLRENAKISEEKKIIVATH